MSCKQKLKNPIKIHKFPYGNVITNEVKSDAKQHCNNSFVHICPKTRKATSRDRNSILKTQNNLLLKVNVTNGSMKLHDFPSNAAVSNISVITSENLEGTTRRVLGCMSILFPLPPHAPVTICPNAVSLTLLLYPSLYPLNPQAFSACPGGARPLTKSYGVPLSYASCLLIKD